MHLVVDGVAEGDEVEPACIRWATCLGHFLYRGLVLVAVFDKVGMVPSLMPCCSAKIREIRALAMVPSSLRISTMTEAGLGRPAWPDRSPLRVAGAGRHAAILRHQREDVAGLHQIGGLEMGATAAHR